MDVFVKPESVVLHDKNPPVLKIYRRRWIVLLIYIFYTTFSGAQWMQYSIISNLVVKYYNVSECDVVWSSMVFMIILPVLIFPATFIVNKMGLRFAALIGAATSAMAASIKLLSIGPNLYYIVMIGQSLAGVSQTFIMMLPPKIATTWFHPKEVSTVCSLGLFATSLGTSIGFLVPPLIVEDHVDVSNIGLDLEYMAWGLAIFCTLALLSVFFYFPKQPPRAPTMVEYYIRENTAKTNITQFLKSLKQLLSNKPFLLHMFGCGLITGVVSAFDTLLNQLVLNYFEDSQKDAGIMGMLICLLGLIGIVAMGVILDKTHKYKESSIIVTTLCAISMAAFIFSLETKTKWMSYLFISIFGIFCNAYLTVAIELGTELTYPIPESTVTGILIAGAQIMTVGITFALNNVNQTLGSFWTLIALIGTIGVGVLMACFTPSRLYRQEAFNGERETRTDYQKVDQIDV